jgi:thiamine-phosphate pyrophosphorylase
MLRDADPHPSAQASMTPLADLPQRLFRASLYGILDTGYVEPARMQTTAARLIEGGIDIVQLRAKGLAVADVSRIAANLRPLFAEAGIPFIINDHPALGHLADGVHVGQDDTSVSQARVLAGPRRLVGKSTHSLAQARAAEAEGADYIGFGPLLPTPTKAGRPAIGMTDIAAVHREVAIPVFCIGGVNLTTLPDAIAAGARRVVIVSGILQAVDIPAYVAECKRLLELADMRPPPEQPSLS